MKNIALLGLILSITPACGDTDKEDADSGWSDDADGGTEGGEETGGEETGAEETGGEETGETGGEETGGEETGGEETGGEDDDVSVGDEIVIELDSNPTTGFSWSVVAPTDELIVALESSEYIPDEVPADIAGSGGTEIFRFRATGVGTTTIMLEYIQPWEPETPVDTYSQEVTVSE